VTKKQCSFEGCTNKVVKGGVCVTHGAKKKRCSFDGCTSNARKGGVCKKHKSWKEEFASPMEQRNMSIFAASRDVPSML
jgi:hypothetical protein